MAANATRYVEYDALWCKTTVTISPAVLLSASATSLLSRSRSSGVRIAVIDSPASRGAAAAKPAAAAAEPTVSAAA